VSAEKATSGGGAVSGSSAAVKSATGWTDCHDDKPFSCHRDFADLDNAQPGVLVGDSRSDDFRINKSLSFRAEPKEEVDRNATSSVFRSRPRRARQSTEQRRRYGEPAADALNVASAPLSRNASINDVRRDRISKRDATASRRSQSLVPAGRRARDDGPKILGNAKQLNGNGDDWSSSTSPANCDSQQRSRPMSVNWYVDLNDAADTEFRPPPVSTSSVNGLRQYQRNESKAGSDILEQDPCRTTTWKNAFGRQERSLATSTLELGDATKTATAAALRSALDDLEERFTQLHRTLSLRQLSSPTTRGTSELRPGTNQRSQHPTLHRPSDSRWRRSMVAARPRNSETFTHTVGSGTERQDPTRTRLVSLSERYRTSIGDNWFDNFPTSEAVVNRQKPTKRSDPRKPRPLSRELKPDFVIYV